MKLPKWQQRLEKSGVAAVVPPEKKQSVAPPAGWRAKLGDWLIKTGGQLREKDRMAPARAGQRLVFTVSGRALGKPVYDVLAVRGGARMGRVEWSNRWRAAQFRPDYDAIFDRQCVAEIHAAMRDFS